MGVDYEAKYGVGVKLAMLSEEENDMTYYCDELEHKSKGRFACVEVGCGDYSGEDNEFYICLKNPFENGGGGVSEKICELNRFLKENNVKTVGTIDVVGGLYMW